MTAILTCLVVLAAALAWWQTREAAVARHELNATDAAVPAKVASALRDVLECTGRDTELQRTEETNAYSRAIEYLDVNADGKNELLVQGSSGVHGTLLIIFTWCDGSFRELARLRSGTPTGFDFGDFDGDGRIEIRTEETDWQADVPYVSAPRLITLIRWDGKEFKEVSRFAPT